MGWQGLSAYFHQGRFVGYLYSGLHGWSGEPLLATSKGLRVDDTLKLARRLYGSAFHSSVYNGGVWWVPTAQGKIEGFTSELTKPTSKIVTIEAGDVGCPSMTP